MMLRGTFTSSTRRRFIGEAASAGLYFGGSLPRFEPGGGENKALIAITLDLEMSRNFPTWDQTHWDYEKGNLDLETKRYAVEAARRVKARGGLIHFFALGQTMEQEDVAWLREIVDAGHPVGNHTYDHVNVKATRANDVQFRFRRAPWLIEGQPVAQVISGNIRLAERALKQRLGVAPAGFRTPGGFHDGLADRPDLQAMLMELGFTWVSSQYPAHPMGPPGHSPGLDVLAGIVAAQAQAIPFRYPSGLVEVPMSPISDVTAFRTGRWSLDDFLSALRPAVAWAIDHGKPFSFLGHPSCLAVTDPRFRAVETICEMVQAAGPRAAIVGLKTIAERVTRS